MQIPLQLAFRDVASSSAVEDAIRRRARTLERFSDRITGCRVLVQAHALNVRGRVKDCSEVCGIFCATANAVELIVAESEGGRGVSDGASPRGVETDADVAERRAFLRRIGYKL